MQNSCMNCVTSSLQSSQITIMNSQGDFLFFLLDGNCYKTNLKPIINCYIASYIFCTVFISLKIKIFVFITYSALPLQFGSFKAQEIFLDGTSSMWGGFMSVIIAPLVAINLS